MKVICLNGAPRSGKDTVGGMLRDTIAYETALLKFASPLDDVAKAILGIADEDYRILREDKKDELLEGTNLTMRDLLITISEDLIKPIFGKTYFAERAAKKVESHLGEFSGTQTEYANYTTIVTDCGFQYEYDHFKSRMERLRIPVRLVRIYREGTNFNNDSREFVTDKNRYDLVNDGQPSDLKEKVHRLSTRAFE